MYNLNLHKHQELKKVNTKLMRTQKLTEFFFFFKEKEGNRRRSTSNTQLNLKKRCKTNTYKQKGCAQTNCSIDLKGSQNLQQSPNFNGHLAHLS